MRGEIADKERLGHMIDCIQEIQNATKGISKEEFVTNHVLRIAVVKWLEIIGEAANNITESTKGKASSLPWKKIVRFRHFVVHEYFEIDFMFVWNLLSQDLLFLEQEIGKLLKEDE